MTEYRLVWLAGARPPVHPEPMRGRQTFASLERVQRFVGNLAPDAQIESLTEVSTTEVDVTHLLKDAA